MYSSLSDDSAKTPTVTRRQFVQIGAVGAGVLLGTPHLWAQQASQPSPPPKPKTNIDDALKVARTKYSLPGLFPGKVVHVQDAQAVTDGRIVPSAVERMFARGLQELTGQNSSESFNLLFTKDDVVGIKVNPAGAGIISTRPEVVDVVIAWLLGNGLPKQNIIIWDRFDMMLKDAGYTPERFPGIKIEGLQTMVEKLPEGDNADHSAWLDKDGNHISAGNFDQDVYYWADVEGPKDLPYLNQHVFNGKYSYFGKLVTQKLTKIINIPVFKNTGNGVSMATKNLGYGAICNTNRLHTPLFFDVCTEVLAFPALRDKLVLNIIDGLRGQYEGGPMPAAQFVYDYNSLFFATDPFAADSVGHELMVQKRKEMGIKVNEHPRFTEYLRYAERLGLGVVDPAKVQVRHV
ncbi:MAG: DUF362 domain-containing protein [Phycisphaerae bacterium]|jgi:hypothetical protein|nr:DUF362 domain-containing protein [Phycisphaerae bacterium]HOO17047.1 DUF362 domain-containing protein [Phycisphaerae bacterium]HRS29497.1 DUF362 domain-containing protein [Phycisphaerae bacterium]HRT42393.1 DUF362 domain-containing protein [Phycisphaerae bacterium]